MIILREVKLHRNGVARIVQEHGSVTYQHRPRGRWEFSTIKLTEYLDLVAQSERADRRKKTRESSRR